MPRLPVLFFALLLTASIPAGDDPRTDRHGDPLPEGAVARLGSIRLRHESQVCCVAFSPDGKLLASGGLDRVIRFWDPATGKELRRLEGHTESVKGIAFSPDGRTLASGGYDRVVRLWDVASGRQVQLFDDPADEIWRLAYSPDGKVLATEEQHGRLVVRDLATSEELWRLPTHGAGSRPLAFSPDGRALATVIDRNLVRMFETMSGRLLCEFNGHEAAVCALAFSPDGRTLASAGFDSGIRLWAADTGQGLGWLPGHTSPAWQFVEGRPVVVGALLFAPDGKTLASHADDGILRLWDVASGDELLRIPRGPDWTNVLAFSPDSKALAIAGGEAVVSLLAVATGESLVPADGHRSSISGITFSSNNRYVATGSWDRTVRLWDPVAGRELRQLREGIGWRGKSAFSQDGKALAAGGVNGTVWSLDTGRARPFGDGSVWFCSFADGDKAVVWADIKEALCVEWLDGSRPRLVLRPGERNVPRGPRSTVAVSPDGRTVASQASRDRIQFWDLPTGTCTAWPVETNDPAALAFSPSGKLLAATDARGVIWLWEVCSGKLVRRLVGDGRFLVFSPDGLSLAVRQRRDCLYLVDVVTGDERASWCGRQGEVLAASFSLDGKRLASAGEDGTVLIWDLTRLPARKRERHSPEMLAGLWPDLEDADPAKAYPAVWALAISDQAPAFLLERLRPLLTADPQRIARLIADLESDDFDTRERASQELARLGDLAEPALRRALAGNPAADVRKRLTQLLEGLDGPEGFAKRRRLVRAVEVLEALGSHEARKALKQIGTAAGTRLQQEAKSALQRLAARPLIAP
jgi:WD40 repeat protein